LYQVCTGKSKLQLTTLFAWGWYSTEHK